MDKNLKRYEVIELIQKKIELKNQLRNVKKQGTVEERVKLSKKIDKIQSKLSSRPLPKT